MGVMDLAGKAAIVTGASRGLGQAMALGLAEAGANVVATDVLDTKETVEKVKNLGRESFGIKVDVTKKSDVEKMVKETVKRFGRVDILVNNAGILRASPAEKMADEDWDKVIAINLKGQFLCAREAGKQMINQKSGRIINVASVAGILGSANSAAYCASKAGIILMTKTLAEEWGKYGINVNAICPGIFNTAMTEGFVNDDQFMQMIKSRVPLGRCGNPGELGGVAVFLASSASSYMTGHALVVDGGWTAGL